MLLIGLVLVAKLDLKQVRCYTACNLVDTVDSLPSFNCFMLQHLLLTQFLWARLV